MSEIRNRRILCNVEELVFQIVAQKIVGPKNISFSDYARSLILKDLAKKGLLPEVAKNALLMGIENIEIPANTRA